VGLKRIRTHHGKIPAKNSVRTVHATSGVTSSVNIVASGPALLRLVRVQGELLDSPIREFADQISLSVRQSISCTEPKSFSGFPALPNLPKIVPSNSIL
jgi:hypothetical protein